MTRSVIARAVVSPALHWMGFSFRIPQRSQPLGVSHLMQNADLTWAQDLGAVTELLSGGILRWFGRSTSHQLWSSAMVVTPALRGMFGLEWNAAGHTLIITPNLPAQCETAKVSAVPLGDKRVNIELRRNRATAICQSRLNGDGGKDTKLASRTPGAKLLNGVLSHSIARGGSRNVPRLAGAGEHHVTDESS